MSIENRLERSRKLVEHALEHILTRSDTLLFQAMRYSVLGGGKRYRPLLCLSSAAALGAEEKSALPFACALELIHNYSLIHDDLPCMDDDDLRRGRPTCHKEFGEDIALLAGDGLLTLAFEIMAEADVPRRLIAAKTTIIHEVARLAGVDGMIGGQLLDITYSAENVTEESLVELMIKKTGALIVEAVRAGARIGAAAPAELRAMTAFGENIGLAFQIRDDILDAAEKTKKTMLSVPNYVRVFGLAKARARVEECVSGGLVALRKAGIKSPELRRLARQLLIE